MDIKLIFLLVIVAVCAGRRSSSPYYGRLYGLDSDSASLERRVTKLRTQVDRDILGRDSYEKHFTIPHRLETLKDVSKLRRRLRSRRRNRSGCRKRYRGLARLRRYRSRTGRKSYRYPRNTDQVDYYDRPYYEKSSSRSPDFGPRLPLLRPLQGLFQNVVGQTLSPVWYVYRRLPLLPQPRPVKPVYNRRDSVEDRRRGRSDVEDGQYDQSEGEPNETNEEDDDLGQSYETGPRFDRRKGNSEGGRERSRELVTTEDRFSPGPQRSTGKPQLSSGVKGSDQRSERRKGGSGVSRERSRELDTSEDQSLSETERGRGKPRGSTGTKGSESDSPSDRRKGGSSVSRELDTSEDRSLSETEGGREKPRVSSGAKESNPPSDRRKVGSDVGRERSRELDTSEDRSLSGTEGGKGKPRVSSGAKENDLPSDRRKVGSGVGRERSRELDTSEDRSLSGIEGGKGKPRVNTEAKDGSQSGRGKSRESVKGKEVEVLESQEDDSNSSESNEQKVRNQKIVGKELADPPKNVPAVKPTVEERVIVGK
ncbi:pre-mRNA-splicing factor CWC25-like isoform X1 [Hermetia illucens]|uniref:pre-mRNA-splicing factor CWC25-like isoform X1 n=1 Tax=Hermetia illucens TaxID=343691 RepID=UPI0018CC57C8|nr:pre-mRNA-splicing factor CWC25-like isoform X1 [Hermetia illucens]